jgi:hypothetical protein
MEDIPSLFSTAYQKSLSSQKFCQGLLNTHLPLYSDVVIEEDLTSGEVPTAVTTTVEEDSLASPEEVLTPIMKWMALSLAKKSLTPVMEGMYLEPAKETATAA